MMRMKRQRLASGGTDLEHRFPHLVRLRELVQPFEQGHVELQGCSHTLHRRSELHAVCMVRCTTHSESSFWNRLITNEDRLLFAFDKRDQRTQFDELGCFVDQSNVEVPRDETAAIGEELVAALEVCYFEGILWVQDVIDLGRGEEQSDPFSS